jgi:Tfp pilus assembly PilM family ATPase
MIKDRNIQIYFSTDKIIFADIQINKGNVFKIKSSVVGKSEALLEGRLLKDQKKAQHLFSTLLKKQQKNPQEKFICDLVLPDSYFYTRLLVIKDKNNKLDVDKYIREKADELLPSSYEELYTKWRVLAQNESKRSVLLAAFTPAIDLLLPNDRTASV